MVELIEYLNRNKIEFVEGGKNSLVIDNKTFYLSKPNDKGLLFDEEFCLIDAPSEYDGYVFRFGGIWYYSIERPNKRAKLNVLKYLGKANVDSYPFLGIHGRYEILNGSRSYKDWCKKANFLGVDILGICEKNTLAGTLSFQKECLSSDIKPIIGATFTIDRNDFRYDVKCYALNDKGWSNMLFINRQINIENNKFVKESVFFDHIEGVIVVVDPKSLPFENIFPIDIEHNFYYQLDNCEFVNNDRDKWYLENLKKYVNSEYKPVLITDAYYLDEEDYRIKKKLNLISGKIEYESNKQYFKDSAQFFNEWSVLFKDTEEEQNRAATIFIEAYENLTKIVNKCEFKISTGNRHLPKYEMTEEEASIYDNNEDLFWGLIAEGIQRKIPEHKQERYLEQVMREYEVIQMGDVLDYFLILRDIIIWSRSNNILTGIGRGSAGGCVISWLLDIIHLDPLRFNLLFERFLNEGRIKVTLPDIDVDFQASKRDDVKAYVEQRYGQNQVCSVGTYTTLKLKAIFKDLGRVAGLSFSDVNYITKYIHSENGNFTDLFHEATINSRLKKFILKNPDIVNDIHLIHKDLKAESVHACATIIVPKDKEIYDWLPVKYIDKDNSKILVSEWEGDEIESAGFLKEDILGVIQLDKFAHIIESIKRVEGVDIDIYSLSYDDDKVYEYFQRGWNGDVFHFGSKGLTGYCKELKPESIDDLIAANALYRPGAIENNYHNEYILRKEGKHEVEYFVGSDEILGETYGVFVYQEQIMKLCQVLGGLSLVEADDVRKAMVKKKYEALHQYKDRFIDNYVKEFGVEREYSENVWDAIDRASTYMFNKSHSAAYSITGYISQWLKVNYPVHFWQTAFTFANDDDIPYYISEIHKSGEIKVSSPDINTSGSDFKADFDNKIINWSLIKVKECGIKAVTEIMKMREDGEFFSLSEFLSRRKKKGSAVNKQVVEHLILVGAFDKLENIQHPKQRLKLIEQFREEYSVKVDKIKDLFSITSKTDLNENWWWDIQQKLLSGFAMFDYNRMLKIYAGDDKERKIINYDEIQDPNSVGINCHFAGWLNDIQVREGKRGEYAHMILEHNYEFVTATVWSEAWEKIKKTNPRTKTLMFVTGKVVSDSYRKCNVINVEDCAYLE